MDYERESAVLKALAHSVRLRLAAGFLKHERNVDCMVRALKLPQSTVSQHLAILRRTGILQVRKEDVRHRCRVVDSRVAGLLAALKGKAPGRCAGAEKAF